MRILMGTFKGDLTVSSLRDPVKPSFNPSSNCVSLIPSSASQFGRRPSVCLYYITKTVTKGNEKQSSVGSTFW